MGHNRQHHSPLLLEMHSSSSPHVHIEFELFPVDQKSDYSLRLNMEPMKIIYDTVTFNYREDKFPNIFFSLFDSQQSIDLLNVLRQMNSSFIKHQHSLSIGYIDFVFIS